MADPSAGEGVGDRDFNDARYSTIKDYASFYLGTGGVTATAADATVLTVNATSINSDVAVFDLTSSVVTVDKTADFKVEAECYFNSGGSSRSEYSVYLEVDDGGGYDEVAGTRAANYQRGYDSGSTSSLTTIVAVTTGDKFRLSIIRTDGGGTTGYQDDNGTRLTFTEM